MEITGRISGECEIDIKFDATIEHEEQVLRMRAEECNEGYTSIDIRPLTVIFYFDRNNLTVPWAQVPKDMQRALLKSYEPDMEDRAWDDFKYEAGI